eukprot:752252-Hanusia_phi.AAC.3
MSAATKRVSSSSSSSSSINDRCRIPLSSCRGTSWESPKDLRKSQHNHTPSVQEDVKARTPASLLGPESFSRMIPSSLHPLAVGLSSIPPTPTPPLPQATLSLLALFSCHGPGVPQSTEFSSSLGSL